MTQTKEQSRLLPMAHSLLKIWQVECREPILELARRLPAAELSDFLGQLETARVVALSPTSVQRSVLGFRNSEVCA